MGSLACFITLGGSQAVSTGKRENGVAASSRTASLVKCVWAFASQGHGKRLQGSHMGTAGGDRDGGLMNGRCEGGAGRGLVAAPAFLLEIFRGSVGQSFGRRSHGWNQQGGIASAVSRNNSHGPASNCSEQCSRAILVSDGVPCPQKFSSTSLVLAIQAIQIQQLLCCPGGHRSVQRWRLC